MIPVATPRRNQSTSTLCIAYNDKRAPYRLARSKDTPRSRVRGVHLAKEKDDGKQDLVFAPGYRRMECTAGTYHDPYAV